jgi:hypothetical protein
LSSSADRAFILEKASLNALMPGREGYSIICLKDFAKRFIPRVERIVDSPDPLDPKDASSPAKGYPEPEFWRVSLRPGPKRLEIKKQSLSTHSRKPFLAVMSFFLLSFVLPY